MRGSAVPTMSWSSMASMIARSSPGSTTSTSRRMPSPVAGWVLPGGPAVRACTAMPGSRGSSHLLADRLV